MGYGALQDFLRQKNPEYTATLIGARVLPLYNVSTALPYLTAAANWMLGELASCLPENITAEVYSALFKALVMPDCVDISCFPVRASAAGAIIKLLENDYLPPEWLPLLQVIVGGIANEEEGISMLFQLLSSVMETGGKDVTAHAPVIVSKLVDAIAKHIASNQEPWSQIFLYKNRMDSFGSSIAQRAITSLILAEWRILHGRCAPELQRIAVTVLSQTTSASNCERNWSMFSRVHTKARNKLTYKKLDLIVFLCYNQKLKLRYARRMTKEELTESFNPINLDYIFDDDDPLNLWLSEKEQSVFEGDDLNWLNLDENEVNAAINIIEDDDPPPDATAPFRYSVDQQPQDMQGSDYESEGHLLLSSSHGGSGGGGDGGNEGANEMGASCSFRQSTDYFTDYFTDCGRGVPVEDDRRRRRSSDKQPREPTQTYRRIRKGKEPVQPRGYPTDAMYGYTYFQEVPSSFTGPGLFAHSGGYDTYGGVLNNYGYSSINTNCPSPPNPSHESQSVGSDTSRRHRDNPPIINRGTMNYRNH